MKYIIGIILIMLGCIVISFNSKIVNMLGESVTLPPTCRQKDKQLYLKKT